VFHDTNGNVVALADMASHEVTARFEYDAFGNVVSAVGSGAAGHPLRFSGRYEDAETGLFYYGFRYLDPRTGRWISRDPIGEAGGVNLYGFAGNDGLNGVDVLGLKVSPYAPQFSKLDHEDSENYDKRSGNLGLTPFRDLCGRRWVRSDADGYLFRLSDEKPVDLCKCTDAWAVSISNAKIRSLPASEPSAPGPSTAPEGSPDDLFARAEAIAAHRNGGNFGHPESSAAVREGLADAEEWFKDRAVDAAVGVATDGLLNGGVLGSLRWADDAVRFHHAWPKYLGGRVQQLLEPLPKSLHDAFHRDLDAILPRAASTAYYQALPNAIKKQNLLDLKTYVQDFDSKHGTYLYDAMVREGFPY
jgi:RHS repeat-associated protein